MHVGVLWSTGILKHCSFGISDLQPGAGREGRAVRRLRRQHGQRAARAADHADGGHGPGRAGQVWREGARVGEACVNVQRGEKGQFTGWRPQG